MLRVKISYTTVVLLGLMLACGVGICDIAAGQLSEPSASRQPGPPATGDILRRLSASVRRGPIAQVVSVRVSSPSGRERVSRVEVMTDPGDEAAGRSRRVALRLGRVLHVEAAANLRGWEFRAVSPRNDEAAYVIDVAGTLDSNTLASRLPPLPIPHAAWAFDTDWIGAGDRDGEFLLPPLGWVRIEGIEQDTLAKEITILGRTVHGPARVTLDEPTLALRSVRGMMPDSDLTLELRCKDADPAAVTWAVSTVGRRMVDSLTALRPLPAELQPGSQVASLGLMRTDLAPFSVIDAMKAQAAEPTESGEGPMLGVLVFYSDETPGGEDAASLAISAMRSMKKNLDRRRLTGEVRTPRVFVQPIAVLDVASFSPSNVREIAAKWDAAQEHIVWTSAGQPLLNRFERGEPVLAAVVDSEMTLLGVARVEVGVNAGDGVLAEVRAIIEETSAPK